MESGHGAEILREHFAAKFRPRETVRPERLKLAWIAKPDLVTRRTGPTLQH